MKVAFNCDFYLYVLWLQFHCVISFKMIIMIVFEIIFSFNPANLYDMKFKFVLFELYRLGFILYVFSC